MDRPTPFWVYIYRVCGHVRGANAATYLVKPLPGVCPRCG